jgi:hypothetical protein
LVSENEDEDELEEEFEHIPFQYSITSYGADYDVDGLVKRIRKGDIYVPIFQRGFVWSYYQASRFIESLLLGLPVPGIFLSKEYGTEKLIVIDGQQRLRTLQFFYDGIFKTTGAEFALKGVQPEFEGKTYKTLEEEDKRRLNDSIIHATIVKQDKPEEDNSSIYYIFERLNTGGEILMPQEIRSCILQGGLNDLLKELNQYGPWRLIYGKPSIRMRDEELILRYFALLYHVDHYSRPMKGFLNRYMGANRHFQHESKAQLSKAFKDVIDVAFHGIGANAFKLERGVIAAIFDSVAVGLSRRLQRGPIDDLRKFHDSYDQLLKDPQFLALVKQSTSDESNVRLRIELATKAFADVP